MVLIWLGAGFLLLVSAVLAALLAFGRTEVGAPREGLGFNTGIESLNYATLPDVQHCRARDGAEIPYRVYPARSETTVILIHGSSSRGRSLHGLASYLAERDIGRCVTLDMRGHGWGRPGDLDHIGQLEDDVADLIEQLARDGLARRLVLLGFSSGGGFALRFAGSRYGEEASAYVFLAPFIHEDSPTLRPDNGWAFAHDKRLLVLEWLNAVGLKVFNFLPVISFAVAEEDRDQLTPDYSFRMSANFRPARDYHANLRHMARPGVLIVGSEDENFRAAAYPDDVVAHAQNLAFRQLDGLKHMDLVTKREAFRAVGEEIAKL